jgi:translation initiation factor IF-3
VISDHLLKENKFCTGITRHNLVRKVNGMIEYLGRRHAVRVMLAAQQRSLKDDANTIRTTIKRVRELVGDRAVEACGMKSNNRKSYGTPLLRPSKK